MPKEKITCPNCHAVLAEPGQLTGTEYARLRRRRVEEHILKDCMSPTIRQLVNRYGSHILDLTTSIEIDTSDPKYKILRITYFSVDVGDSYAVSDMPHIPVRRFH